MVIVIVERGQTFRVLPDIQQMLRWVLVVFIIPSVLL